MLLLLNEFCDRQTMLLLLNECIDLRVNLMRLDLSGWWDEILKNMFDTGACTHYRVLIEPLDIANFYRFGKNED